MEQNEEKKEDAPVGESSTPSKGPLGGVEDHLKKHWKLYVAFFGIVTIGVALYVHNRNANNAASATQPTYTGTASSVPQSGSVDTSGTSGGTSNSGVDTSGVFAQLNTALQQISTGLSSLNSQETTNQSILQQIAAGKPVTTGNSGASGVPGSGGGGNTGNPLGGGTLVPTGQVNWNNWNGNQSVLPPAIGTPGYSTNRYIYTTQAGDTYNSLTAKANWQNSGPDFLRNYNGNAPIFQSIGYQSNEGNVVLPSGLKLSL